MSVPQEELLPSPNLELLKETLIEKKALLAAADKEQKKVQQELITVKNARTRIEKQIIEVPEGERNSEKFKKLLDYQRALSHNEIVLSRRENQLAMKKNEAYFEFDEARAIAIAVKPRLWMSPVRGFNKNLQGYNEAMRDNEEHRATIQHVLDATQHGQQLRKSAERKETKLHQAERYYQEIKAKIEEHLRNGVADQSIGGILERLQLLRATLNERGSDYVATKAKALEAFKLAENFKQRLNVEQRNRLQQELISVISKGQSKIPKPGAAKSTGIKAEEVRLRREIDESFGKISEMVKNIQEIKQQRDTIQQHLQNAIQEKNSEATELHQGNLKAAGGRLKAVVAKQMKAIDTMKTKFEGVLKNRHKFSKDFLKFVQEKLIVLKRPIWNPAESSKFYEVFEFEDKVNERISAGKIPRPIRAPSIIAKNHVAVPGEFLKLKFCLNCLQNENLFFSFPSTINTSTNSIK